MIFCLEAKIARGVVLGITDLKPIRRGLVEPIAAAGIALAGVLILARASSEPAPLPAPPVVAALVPPPLVAKTEPTRLEPPAPTVQPEREVRAASPESKAALPLPAPPPSAPPRPAALPAPPGPRVRRKRDRSANSLAAQYKVEITWDGQVADAPNTDERLKIVDHAIGTADPGDTVPFIGRLLDRTPGATAEDREIFRMALIARLGVLKFQPKAVARLVGALDASAPRAERLAAIDALARDGTLPEPAKTPLDRISDSDRDLEVRRRARQVLGKPTG